MNTMTPMNTLTAHVRAVAAFFGSVVENHMTIATIKMIEPAIAITGLAPAYSVDKSAKMLSIPESALTGVTAVVNTISEAYALIR